MFTFRKTINITTTKNVLCQIPRAVVAEWGLKEGDTLELTYEDDKVTIIPNVQRRSDVAEQGNEMAGAPAT